MKPYYEEENIKIYNADCLEVMKDMPDKSVDLVVTSPPYNKGYYDKHKPPKTDIWKQRNICYGDFKDNLEPKEYIKQQTQVLKEATKIFNKTI